MSTIKLLKKALLVFCLLGTTILVSSCYTNQPISSNEKGYGGEGSGEGGSGHGGLGGVGGGAR
ncbi:Uncharacterised protein [Legionella steigerwaltii]|uniref:Lipoprotein n=1 Tax=Legionella steigerwaltii TaxID=460 RepID=A0A378LF91_9GAMM|nr:hypothetical protein [Legionella steigerwaltii]KTD79582.1 hypothetical protein Lstg_0798 [Legionella steigerwaltii]STY24532.1 Uncharacterised protein [Legionella steigerwaltii]